MRNGKFVTTGTNEYGRCSSVDGAAITVIVTNSISANNPFILYLCVDSLPVSPDKSHECQISRIPHLGVCERGYFVAIDYFRSREVGGDQRDFTVNAVRSLNPG